MIPTPYACAGRRLVCAAALVLAGCASDADRLDELQIEAARARAQVLVVEQEIDRMASAMVDSLVAAGKLEPWVKGQDFESKLVFLHSKEHSAFYGGTALPPVLDSLATELAARRDRALLAERDLERFLR